MTQAQRAPVLHAIEAFCGGALESCAQLCHLIDDRPAIVLHGIRPETPANFIEKFPVGTRFIPWNVSAEIQPRRDIRGVLALRQLAKQTSPALIHAHSSKAGALARMSFPLGAPPVIYSPRGYAYLRRDIGVLSRSLYRIIESVLGLSKHITVACGHDEGRISVVSQKKLRVIPNGLRTEEFRDLAKRTPVVSSKIVGSGRNAPSKNLKLFFDIARAMENRDLEFLWVGGDEAAKQACPPNVAVSGFIPSEQCLAEIAEAYVFLQTSLWEGLPRAVLEAMALGVPVLAHPSIGSEELVSDGAGGQLCENLEVFIAKLKEIIDDPVLRARLSAGAQQKIDADYNLKSIRKQWKSLYALLAS